MNDYEMYIINPDYLEFRCKDQSGYISNFVTNGSNRLYIISQNLKLSKTADYKYYSSRFLNCYEILLQDEKVGYLYSNPIRNSYYSANDICSIRIDNQVLYDPNLNTILEQVVTEMQLTIKGITRLDIAYDTTTDILKRFKRLYNNTGKYTYKNRGKTIVNGTGIYDTQVAIGSLRSQGKTVIIYDKSTLLRQQSKDYLQALYESIFGHKDIYRVEVRITSKSTNKYEIDILQLGNKDYLESLFESIGGSLIDFRYKESNNNTTRQARINFIELNKTGREITKNIPVRTIKGNNSMKFLIRKLHSDIDKDEFSAISREIKLVVGLYVKMSGLQDWYRKKVIMEGNK